MARHVPSAAGCTHGTTRAVVEAQHQLHRHRARGRESPRTRRTTSELLPRGGMKSISGDGAVGGLEVGLEDQRVIAVARVLVASSAAGRMMPAAMFAAAEQRGEAGGGVEARPAEPVDRSVAPDQRRGLAVADERVVFDAAQPRDHHPGNRKRCIQARRVGDAWMNRECEQPSS